MRDDVRQALAIDRTASVAERTVDITTTGRRSGQPRRIETCFYRFDDTIYLSGVPGPRRRDWLRNLVDHPEFTFHLKNGITADLAATASEVTDPDERRRVLGHFVEVFNEQWTEGSPWPRGDVDEWVQNSPLAEVTFVESD